MNNPAISIIIPVYNAEKYLRRCIESVLSQSFTDFELILVDDGSKDSSPQICDEYVSQDTRVRVIHKANGGVSAARNDGLDIAKGEYITFIDSDDWVEREYIQSLYDKRSLDFVIGNFINEPSGKKRKINECTFIGDKLKDYIKNTYLSNGYPWGKLFKNKIINNNAIRFKKIKVYEDLLFCLEYVRHCSSICCMSKAHYHYFNPIEKSVPEKFPLSKEEVAWLYKNTSREVGLICERFNARPIKLSFNFYEHLNIVELYQTGNDAILYEAYRLLYPNASKAEYYNDEFASPIRIVLKKIFHIKLIDYRKTIKTMKLLKSKEYSSYLTLLNYKSRLHCICAYCIDKKYFFLAMLVVFFRKLKVKVIK